MATAPFPVSALRSVDLVVPNLVRAIAFYVDVWGLVLQRQTDGVAYLRGAGSDPYLLSLRSGAAPAVAAVAYRAEMATDMAELRQRVLGAGATAEGGIGASTDGAGGHSFSVRDPQGRRLTIVQNDERLTPLTDLPSRPVRLAHVNINCDDSDREIAFYRDGLGFQVTDRNKLMNFLRTNSDHHAVVLANDTIHTLNHIAFLHNSWEDVMLAGGRMCDAGYPIGWGPGRHGPGANVYLYFVDPFGIVIEHTAEILQVVESYRVGGPHDWVWPPGRSDRWGIAPAKTEECKRAQRAIPFV